MKFSRITTMACAVAAIAVFQSSAARTETVGPLMSYAPAQAAGQTDFNVTDRIAIDNLIQSYALSYDTYDVDAHFALYTPDAVFVVGTPGMKPMVMSGEEFHKTWRARINDFKKSGNLRRHLMSNIVFLDQTADTAHISVVGLLTNTKEGKAFTPVSTLNYEGWLVKVGGVWKIKRWHDFPDADNF